MRILVVAHRFLPGYVAGTEVYAGALARGLRDRGHALRIFTGDPAARARHTYVWDGLPVEAVPWGLRPAAAPAGPISTFLAGFLNPAAERRFNRLCAEFRPEIVHIHHLLGLSPRLPAIARRRGARVVVTLHDYWFVCSNTWLYRWNREVCPGPGLGYHCGGCALHRLGRRPQPGLMALAAPLFIARTAILRRALLAADRLIAPSTTVARLFARQGVPAAQIQVLPHGLAEAPASPVSRPPAGPLRLAYIGSLIPAKGAHIAIQAVNGLSQRDVQLRLYGDTASDPGYVSELRRQAQHPGIEFRGPLARDRVGSALRDADVLVLPSLWYEPYSLIVDEALSAGLPVLASDHGAPAERIVPGQNGLTAPPGDVEAWRRQIQRLLNDVQLLPGLRSRVRPPKALSQHLDEIESLYGQVLSQS